ncbi:MAG: hypothetical protein C9356_02110 [Oleiphilus sp.]|nr:MAG: hypothetical protein C9356_02110 [Oleiphilus sp.]
MAFVALLFYFVFVFIRPQEFWPPILDMPLVKISLIFCALFMLTQKKRRFDAPTNKLLAWLLAVIMISGVVNEGFSGALDSAQLFLTTILLPFLVIQNLIQSPRKQQIVFILLLVFGMIMVHDGMAQKASATGFGWSGAGLSQGTRITYLGIFSDPNDLGMFFVMLLPIAAYVMNLMPGMIKLLPVSVILALLYGIYMTNSRGALLGTLSLLGFWFLLKYGLKKSIFAGMIAAPVILVVMSMFRAIDSEEASAEGRLDAWYEGFQLLKWKPGLGVGMGNFTDYHYLTAHNSFVLVFSELGLSGYFLWTGFLTFSALAVCLLWSRWLQGNKAEEVSVQERKIALTLTYSMIGYLVTCFFLSRAYTPLLYIFMAMNIATFYRVSEASLQGYVIRMKDFRPFALKVSFGSLVAIYLFVKVML